MAYDESIYRPRETDRRDLASSALNPPSDGDSPYRTDLGHQSSVPDGDFPIGNFRSTDQATTRVATPFDDVFDDPAYGEPGRDRMRVHALWEVLLFLGAAALAFLIYREDPGALRGAALSALLVSAATLGLLALAAGLALRSGVPNLAIGPVAVAAALYLAEHGGRDIVAAAWPVAAAGAAIGLVLALFVVGLHVPGWAASLAAALALGVFIERWSGPVEVAADYGAAPHAAYLFGGFAAVSLLAGLFGTVRAIRRAVGRFRSVADPARRRGGGAAVLATVALLLSTVYAVLAGVLLAAGGSAAVHPSSGFEWTGLALGAALLGGTSAFGRRGGICGNVLAVVLLTLFTTYADQRAWDIAPMAVAAAAMGVGLVVTRLVERFGRPRFAADGNEWAGSATSSPRRRRARADGRESWSSALSAQSTDSRTDVWASDRWGGA